MNLYRVLDVSLILFPSTANSAKLSIVAAGNLYSCQFTRLFNLFTAQFTIICDSHGQIKYVFFVDFRRLINPYYILAVHTSLLFGCFYTTFVF